MQEKDADHMDSSSIVVFFPNIVKIMIGRYDKVKRTQEADI